MVALEPSDNEGPLFGYALSTEVEMYRLWFAIMDPKRELSVLLEYPSKGVDLEPGFR